MDIYAKLKELLSAQIRKKHIDIDSVTPETRLEDLGLDSLDTAELLINIEQEFNLSQVSQEEMLDVRTVEDVKNLIENELPQATIVETNTYYEGPRYTTESHRETLKVNGWTFCPVDIMDEHGTAMLPVVGGKWFTEMSVGKDLFNYDSLLALTHFKGHTMGGFGGSDKNLGIGCADGRIGKDMIHRNPNSTNMWSNAEETLMERMTESTKSVIDHFAGHIAYINVMRNMSVSCDCEGVGAEPVVTPDVGILASLDILAVDQACVDIIFAMDEKDHRAMVERMTTRHGLRQLTYMKELGMGHDRYHLIDIDNGDVEITAKDAVAHVKHIAD